MQETPDGTCDSQALPITYNVGRVLDCPPPGLLIILATLEPNLKSVLGRGNRPLTFVIFLKVAFEGVHLAPPPPFSSMNSTLGF
jgi:hypothetical protein